ncbi:MAG: crossover junction endodeoxyribonuclease RuvC [Dehalococcoidia bacterium]|nr:crossover junction endodeoxyribonuclease RuvC [Dehalococcoidia bacterium]
MRILGVDPGSVCMGYGIIETEPLSLVTFGVLRAPARSPLESRLLTLFQKLEEVFLHYQPAAVAVEEPFVAENPRAALAVGRAQAVAFLLTARAGLPIHRYAPTQVRRQVTSYGGGDKLQVQEMVRVLLGMDAAPQPTDASDALAVALCHLLQERRACP